MNKQMMSQAQRMTAEKRAQEARDRHGLPPVLTIEREVVSRATDTQGCDLYVNGERRELPAVLALNDRVEVRGRVASKGTIVLRRARYLAEVQLATRTLSREGTAAEVAAWLAGWGARDENGKPLDQERRERDRSVAVYRLDELQQVDALVELRRTRELGTALVLAPPGAVVDPDATWRAAIATASNAS